MLCSALSAGEVRTFTDEETERTLQAEMVGKSPDGQSVSLKLSSGRVVIVKLERLTKEDQTYVERWVKAMDQVTCRVEGKPYDGYKRISVAAISGTGDTVLDIQPGVLSTESMALVPYTRNLKAGEKIRDSVTVPNRYTVTLRDEHGHILDEEKYNRKTGMK